MPRVMVFSTEAILDRRGVLARTAGASGTSFASASVVDVAPWVELVHPADDARRCFEGA
jgi:hypothetical protein